jgi:hypothetical protein
MSAVISRSVRIYILLFSLRLSIGHCKAGKAPAVFGVYQLKFVGLGVGAVAGGAARPRLVIKADELEADFIRRLADP